MANIYDTNPHGTFNGFSCEDKPCETCPHDGDCPTQFKWLSNDANDEVARAYGLDDIDDID